MISFSIVDLSVMFGFSIHVHLMSFFFLFKKHVEELSGW